MLNEDAAVHLPAPASCVLAIDGGVIVGTSDGELLRYSLSDGGEFALQAQTTLWRGVEVDGMQTISTTEVLVCCGGRLAVHGASALDRAATLCATCTGAFCRQTAAGASRDAPPLPLHRVCAARHGRLSLHALGDGNGVAPYAAEVPMEAAVVALHWFEAHLCVAHGGADAGVYAVFDAVEARELWRLHLMRPASPTPTSTPTPPPATPT